ncbi:hypothetical protein OH76DRAFT_96135 [Lentinus brumalis]|uniref:Fibronectin type III/BRCA1 domain-containing protein n=1 Tax=Lentinus brumalis TaxID=2498619 RepID=A0A371CQK0_9APHY|nr:hypothetical protein OH76DRAFT_96135 [Polyporus brumalis]
MAVSQDSFMFTVGKLDAGMAILLGERAHLIEFPSLLLPPGVSTGSIVNISVQRNMTEEKKRENDFWNLQSEILDAFGTRTPENPKLELRNITQTSVTLEWPKLELATAKLRSLDLYRDRQRVAAIPSPLTNTSTKVSGLQLDTEYTFQLVLRTTAGVYPSNVLRVRTHTMTDTSGISVCFGTVEDDVLLENAKLALREMGAKWSDKIQIDTTHFVCTTPASTPSAAHATNNPIINGPGVEYQKALQLSIPVVQPQWVLACHAEKKMMPIRPFYLGESPSSPSHFRPQSMSQANLSSPSQRSATSSPTQQKAANRQSLPPQRVSAASPPAMSPTQPSGRGSAPRIPEEERESFEEEGEGDDADADRPGRVRKGTLSKNFRFPPSGPAQPPPPVPPVPAPPTISVTPAEEVEPVVQEEAPQTPPKVEEPEPTEEAADPELTTVGVVAPSSVEVPPPPPVDKERPLGSPNELDDDVGETEEISLN